MLLDTHVLLWGWSDPDRIPAGVQDLLRRGETEPVWSVVGTIELSVKHGLGKLRVPGSVESFVEEQRALMGLEILPVTHRHAIALGGLPQHHRDVFDRLLVAQAMVEGLPLVTSDGALRAYGIEVIW